MPKRRPEGGGNVFEAYLAATGEFPMTQFEKGNKHGKGRRLGSKNRLTAQILEHMEIVWNELVTAGKVTSIDSKSTGLSALRTMARQDPSGFIRTYAALLPRAIATDEDGDPISVIVTGVPRAGRDK